MKCPCVPMADVRRFRAESDHQSPLGFAIGHAETEPKLLLFDARNARNS